MNTIDRLRKWQKELQEKFLDEDVAYTHVSMTQFSTAQHYGSAVINGRTFFYNPHDDTLIRGDVLRFLNKLETQEKEGARHQNEGGSLFGCKYEHLLGMAGILTEDCTLWWSEEFAIPQEGVT